MLFTTFLFAGFGVVPAVLWLLQFAWCQSRTRSLKAGALTDESIINSWPWHFAAALQAPARWFYRHEVEGLENLPATGGILMVTMHTTHNEDIFLNVVDIARDSGRVVRALAHRVVLRVLPIFRYFGAVPGHRTSAVEMLKQGLLVGVIPGGSEEAMRGNANAYQLYWKSSRGTIRKGFAHCAKAARATIIPVMTENAEEMKFNPVMYLWNLIGGSTLFSYLVKLRIPVFSWLLYQVGSILWFVCAFATGIPVPVKVITHFGKPVEYDPDTDEPIEIAHRTHDALQAMLDKYHPGQSVDWVRALQQSWSKPDATTAEADGKDAPTGRSRGKKGTASQTRRRRRANK